ncbi:hypothetical protein LR48_Vigan09g009800 [Vigna angularis]|uniref:Uncharacterized protein n=1 Tax=Phaseolus angularis TaxID=3914 RepID=A0A0L9V9Z7_PHAAN|nr:hypothetical protein LR48_Vigan09g009800 [Vigna angularis]
MGTNTWRRELHGQQQTQEALVWSKKNLEVQLSLVDWKGAACLLQKHILVHGILGRRRKMFFLSQAEDNKGGSIRP